MPIWPVPSVEVGKVTTRHNAPQHRAPGYTGSLPANHAGIDIPGKQGDDIVAPEQLKITAVDYAADYGHYVIAQGLETGQTYRFAHLQSATVRKNATIAGGSRIGLVGQSGNADGAHLHFETFNADPQGHSRQVDPLTLTWSSGGAMADGDTNPAAQQIKNLETSRDSAKRIRDTLQDQLDQTDPTEDPGVYSRLTAQLSTAEQRLGQAEQVLYQAQSQQQAYDKAGTRRKSLNGGYVVEEVSDGKGNWNVDTSVPPVKFTGKGAGEDNPDLIGGKYIWKDGRLVPAPGLEGAISAEDWDLQNAPNGALVMVNKKNGQTREVMGPAPKTMTGPEGTVYPLDPRTNLPDIRAGVTPRPKPREFEDPQAQLSAEVPRLQSLAKEYRDFLASKIGTVLTREQAEQEFDNWWGQNVDSYVQGLTTLATRQNEQTGLANWQTQRKAQVEDFGREADINKVGYEAGRDAISDYVKNILPNTVAPNFAPMRQQQGADISEFLTGGDRSKLMSGVQGDRSAFMIQPPDFDAIAQHAAERAVGPLRQAAQQITAGPPPQMSGININDLLARVQKPQFAPPQ